MCNVARADGFQLGEKVRIDAEMGLPRGDFDVAGWRTIVNGASVSTMCGRFTQRYSWREVHAFLSLRDPARNLRARYNVAPSQEVAAVRADEHGRGLSMLRWGLIPGWAKDARIGYKLINARAETASTKPSFRAAYRSRRCLIPADGFYEWTRRESIRQPWLIRFRDDALFAFAGLWERWTVPDGPALPGSLAAHASGDVVETCTILTTTANEAVGHLHHRMPVILSPDEFDPWLAGESVPLDPCAPETMTVDPVSTLVNSPKNDNPECVERITLE